MKESKLLQILHQISTDEWPYLYDFIHSPYHNKNKHVIALFGYLHSAHPFFTAEVLEKKLVWQALYPNNIFDDLKLRHVSSLLLAVVEQFLVQQQYRNETVNRELLLAKCYRQRGLPIHYRQVARKLEQHKQSQLYATEDHLWQLRLIEEEKEAAESLVIERRQQTVLQEVSNALDDYYMLKKVRLACSMINYENILKHEYHFQLVDEVMAYLAEKGSSNALINLYQAAYYTLKGQQPDAYYKLKALLLEHTAHIPASDARELQAIARNFCIKQLNQGNTAFIAELFEQYHLAIKHNLLSNDDGTLSPSTYKNVVAVGLHQKAYVWTEQFIVEHVTLLDRRFRDDYLSYNLAKLYYEKGDKAQVLSHLLRIETYHDVFVSADARTLLAKAYFELDETGALESLLESFMRFLNRHKELGYHKENYKNFILITQKLMYRIHTPKLRQQLKEEIDKKPVLTEKSWLLDKLANM